MKAVNILKMCLFCVMLLWAFLVPVQAKKTGVLRGSDVMATVEGANITRRDLTYFWIQVDRTLPPKLGDALAEHWKADRGAAAQYALSDAEIYHILYTGNADYKPVLNGLITTRLIGILAQRQHITVTAKEMQAKAHALFEDFRRQTKSTLSDAEVMAKFQVPREVFMNDMTFRLQTEKLLTLEFAHKNGHPIGAGDWLEVRALFARAEDLDDAAETEKQYAAAKKRMAAWTADIQNGQRFEDIARLKNEDASRDTGGLHGLALRGTGTPDNVLFTLKPGAISSPIRVRNGWFVFTAGRSGKDIPAAERAAAWKAVVEAQSPAFLDGLRKRAHITQSDLPAKSPPPKK